MAELTQQVLRSRIIKWIVSNLGWKNASNRWERSMRLLEEAIEVAQAEYVAHSEVIRLVDRVYSRPVGNPVKEAGGLAVCLLAYCNTYSVDPDDLAYSELLRIEELKNDAVFEKQCEKARIGLGLDPVSEKV